MKFKNRMLFGSYSYLNNIYMKGIDLMPFPMRKIIYKISFGKMDKDVYIDHEVYFRYFKKIFIGKNVTINRGCKFFASYSQKGVKIQIGNNVAIAPYVTFYAAGHDYKYLDLPDNANSIIVGDNVWIGGRSIILPGVKIGEGAVIGAGSVVTKDIPDWTIAVGNPAKVIKKREIKQK